MEAITLMEQEAEQQDPRRRSFWEPSFSIEDYHPKPTRHESAGDLPAIHQGDSNSEDSDLDSPYPEVRASVHPTDDPTLPVATFRAYLLGTLMCILLPGINQFFIYRYPNIMVQGIIAQLVVHPLGLLLARLPKNGKWKWINPGDWNVKEHTLVYIMANVSAGSAYATDIIATQRFFYNQNWGWAYKLLLVLSTQLIGFSFAGILHRMLVTPASMVWPATLVNTALFNTLHVQTTVPENQARHKSKQLFFYLAAGSMFLWTIFPSYLFTALSNFDWVTWIKPDSQVINLLFGYQSGAGMSLLTFDWGMIAAVQNPLATPWWVTANVLGGFVVFIWLLGPILYYTNTFYAKYLPFSSAKVFDNTASTYNISRMVTDASKFDLKAYTEYSPVYMTVSSALSYGLNFAAVTATLVHCILFFRQQSEFWHHLRYPPAKPDIHARLAARYPSIPRSWYIITFLANVALAVTAITAWPTEMPVWSLCLAILLAGVVVLPVGVIQAVTNMQMGLNVVSEMIIGAIVPGKPVPMMIFKTYGYITTTQALGFMQDMKIAHYMHLPPRPVFFCQFVAAIIGSLVQLGVQDWVFSNIPNICSVEEKVWWCPHTRTFFSASVLYGLIGPKRLFGPGSLYSPLCWFFLIGAMAPLITWALSRRYPNGLWKYVCWPVIFSCVSLLPPYLPINFIR
ncbi:OPT family small oligopeptide transporter [Kwoniella heveanensis BCC8398]|uniref:OPT family small oligopeptide transporter n=1 Tax=Kwoniella heveanensis BCC8398 TaxID=1296120 RepID=A0A1B9GIW8_9TREE|nr:OPT family small oligopeptide transporter [Kwoniella heveanensis BCC8398]